MLHYILVEVALQKLKRFRNMPSIFFLSLEYIATLRISTKMILISS